MTELIAKPVLKNKFWIVENSGNKIATIQAIEGGGVVYVDDSHREKFATIKLLSKAHNIVFDKEVKQKAKLPEFEVYGLPVKNKPWNIMWDVKRRFGVFTKTSKSKSFYCAGYYLIKFNNGWAKSYCPKLITVNRYTFQGPFKTKDDMVAALKLANDSENAENT